MKKLMTALAMLVCTAGWAQRYGVTNFSASYLRQSAGYEAALETQELMGIVVEITEADGYWLKIKTPQPYTAWCTNMGIVEMTAEQLEAYEAAPKYIVTACYSQVLESAKDGSQVISDLVQGDILRTVSATDKHGKEIKSKNLKGYCPVMLPDSRVGYVLADDIMALDKWVESRKLTTDNVVSTAKEFVGTPYLWGGMTPKGFDCSGFVRHVYLMNGVVLPRNASQQAVCGVDVTDFSRLKAGDLLFFGQKGNLIKKEKISHVGIYIGGGKFIHCSQVVRINSLNEGASDYYSGAKRLIRAKRLVSTEESRELNVSLREYLPM